MSDTFNQLPNQEKAKGSNTEQLNLAFEIAKPEDWRKLSAIRIEALKQDPESFIGRFSPQTPEAEDEAGWRSILEDPERFIMFVKEGEEIIGFAGAIKDPEKGEGFWYIQWAYIKPNSRGHGLGEKLYRERINEIKRRGGIKAHGLILKSNKNYEKVLELNQKLGFRVVPNEEPNDTHYISIEANLTT